jgi:Cupin
MNHFWIIAQVEVPVGAWRAPHLHTNTPELAVVLEGKAKVGLHTPQKEWLELELEAGNCVYFPLGWPHWFRNAGSGVLRVKSCSSNAHCVATPSPARTRIFAAVAVWSLARSLSSKMCAKKGAVRMKPISWLIAVLIALSACTPAPKYKLTLPTSALTIARGSSQSFTLGVQRYKGYGGVALVTARSGTDGVTITPAQASIGGDSQIYTVSVSSSAAIGPVSFFLKPDVGGYGSGGSVTISVR